ncbi:MAG: hypothetical protein FWD57_05980 [Polyangiaceae bacterium]|nr:hypothetical protein [Polyangiaceae bacterium]
MAERIPQEYSRKMAAKTTDILSDNSAEGIRVGRRRSDKRRVGITAPTTLSVTILALCTALGCVLGCARTNNHKAARSSFVLGAPIELESPDQDVMSLLGPPSQRLRSERVGPLRVIASGGMIPGDRVGGFIKAPSDSCIVSYARGTRSVEDLDILVFDDAGTTLMADTSVGPSPAVVVCPPHPERIYIMARLASGQGFVALGVHAFQPSRRKAVAQALDARSSREDDDASSRDASAAGAAREIDKRREELGGHWTEVQNGGVPLGPRTPTYLSASLPAGRCLDFLVIPNIEVRGLQMEVADERGVVITQGQTRGSGRVALVCSPVDTTLTLDLRPHHGFGFATVVISKSEVGAERELAVRPDARRAGPMLPLDEVSRKLSTSLAQVSVSQERPKVVGRGTLRAGAAAIHKHKLPIGCTRIDALVGTPLTGVRVSMWHGDTLWARSDGGEIATVFGCTDQPTEVEIEAEATGQAGQYAIEARTESEVPARLRTNTVAAARLLARVNAGGTPVPYSALHGVKPVDIDDSNRSTMSVSVPSRSCRTVVAALGPGATGVGLVAVVGGEVVERKHGNEVSTMRLCSGNNQIRAEVRVSVAAGRTQALVGVLDR